jgi:hypothetical protein
VRVASFRPIPERKSPQTSLQPKRFCGASGCRVCVANHSARFADQKRPACHLIPWRPCTSHSIILFAWIFVAVKARIMICIVSTGASSAWRLCAIDRVDSCQCSSDVVHGDCHSAKPLWLEKATCSSRYTTTNAVAREGNLQLSLHYRKRRRHLLLEPVKCLLIKQSTRLAFHCSQVNRKKLCK